ncbi:hypothetical protein B0I35DRAFT_365249 [Stachybotrys elegans]|uniref:Cell cycle control protein n=1 Tax=Stachybotrys elegans TaxID=80388 RepID=A0A8K0SGT1_9HYPO|nr:hypothetical protein B0I35DRAFT_365249 [Stachybotrys elegans]
MEAVPISSDDELVEIEVDYDAGSNNTLADDLILPRPHSARPSVRPTRIERRRNHRSTSSRQPSYASTPNPQAVIDLTEEPDSPELVRAVPAPTSASGRNPRRTNSQRVSPPRLARSDGTFMGRSAAQQDVIDLTDDTEPAAAATTTQTQTQTQTQTRNPDHLYRINNVRMSGSETSLSNMSNLARFTGLLSSFNRLVSMPMPFDVTLVRSAYPPTRAESQKPDLEPPPPTREGFTRDTCAEPADDDERVVVCPACNEELAYDPTGQMPTHNAFGKRKRRAPGEHHFWALKRCGHVYCADCFDNRRPTKAGPRVGFRPTDKVNEMICAVDDCDTRVNPKSEWVGIFL